MSISQKGMCAERAGFLFPHDCGQVAARSCAICKKEICQEHTAPNAQHGQVCTACGKKEKQNATQKERADGGYYDDPYFYSSHYYYGYGNYGAGHWGSSHVQAGAGDFTSADAGSFQREGNESFERDMLES